MDSDASVHLDGLDPHVQMWIIVQQRIHVRAEDPVWMDQDLIPVAVQPTSKDPPVQSVSRKDLDHKRKYPLNIKMCEYQITKCVGHENRL